MQSSETRRQHSTFQQVMVAAAAFLLAGVLYVGDTTAQNIVSALPPIPLAIFVLIAVAISIALAVPRSELTAAKSSLHISSPKQWPLALWALALFLVWCLWMMLSSLWAPPGAAVGITLLAFALLIVIGMLSATLFYLRPGALLWLWLAIGIYSLVFLYGGLTGPQYVGRMTAFGGGPNVFARFMIYGVAATIFFALWHKRLLPILVLAAPFAYGLVASGSRGATAAAGVLFLFTVIALFLHLGWKWATALYATVALILLVAYERFIAGTDIEQYFYTRFIQLTFEKNHDSGRGLLHDEAFRLMAENRVFGAGLHSFEVLVNTEQDLEHPHNIFYTVGVEAGVVGIVLLAATLIAMLLAAAHSFTLRSAGLTFAVAMTILAAQLFSGYYYDSRPVWSFGFGAIFAIAALRQQAEKEVLAEVGVPESDSARPQPALTAEAETTGEENQVVQLPIAAHQLDEQTVPPAEAIAESRAGTVSDIGAAPSQDPITDTDATAVPGDSADAPQWLVPMALAGAAAVGIWVVATRGQRRHREALLDARAQQWLNRLSD